MEDAEEDSAAPEEVVALAGIHLHFAFNISSASKLQVIDTTIQLRSTAALLGFNHQVHALLL